MSRRAVIEIRNGAAGPGEATPIASPDGGIVMCAAAVSGHLHTVRALIREGHRGAVIDRLEPSGTARIEHLYARLPPLPGAESVAATWASARRLAIRLEGHAVVGHSSFRHDPDELAEATIEAEMILAVLMRHDDPSPQDLNGGTYRLLFRTMASDQRVLRDFCESTVGPLRRYDVRHGGELVRTLRTYLGEARCNMNATAAATCTHRHTVAYRLERTKQLTGLDPSQPADREQLGLGLKIQLILEATGTSGAPIASRLSRSCRVSEYALDQIA